MSSLSLRSFPPLTVVTSSPSKSDRAACALEQVDHGAPQRRLAAAGLAHDAQRLALLDRQRHVIDRVQHAPGGREVLLQMPGLDQRRHAAPLPFGRDSDTPA